MITQERLEEIATTLWSMEKAAAASALEVGMAANDSISATDVDLGNLYQIRADVQSAIDSLERA